MKYSIGVLLTFAFVFSQAQDGGFSRPDLPGDLMVDIGINSWSDGPDTLSTLAWGSKSVGVYYTKRRAFNSKLSLQYGIGFGLEKIGFRGNTTLIDTLNFITELTVGEVEKNRFAMTFLDIPIDFRFHPKGTENGEGLFIGVGGILGVNMKAQTKWKYAGGDKTQKNAGKFNLENFRYGYQIRAGFKGVHFFYKGYLNNTFKSPIGGTDGGNPSMSTFGINVTGF